MPMNGYEKAAIFLTSVGEDVAAQILKDLDPEDIGKITSYMARNKKKDKAKLESVLQETMEKVTGDEIGLGGEDYVKKILSKGLGVMMQRRSWKWCPRRAPSNHLSGSMQRH